MPPIRGLHSGQRRYAELQKAYSRAWRSLSAAERSQFGSYNQWRTSDAGRSVKRSFDEAFRGSNTADTRPDNGEPSTSRTRSNDDDDDFNLDNLFSDIDWNNFEPVSMADIQNNLPEAPSASSVAPGGSTQEPMDTEQLGSGAGGSGRGAIAATGSGISTIMKNPRLKTMHLSFQKKWFKYTYGYAHSLMDGRTIMRVLTPYAYYPVDWVPWYLSPQEFMSLPFNSKIVKVSCDIHLLGTRTAFDHGTSLTGTATTEYVPIIKYCVGLNNKIYLDNRPLDSAASEPMKPTGVKDKSLAEQFQTMYGIAGAAEIPRHLNWYAGILYNKEDGEYDGVPTMMNYRLDKVLTTGLANKCMDKAIINYTFIPSNGYIKPTKKVLLPMYNKNDGFADDVNYKQVIYKHQLPHVVKLSTQANERGTVLANQDLANTSYNYTNRATYNYYQSVEGYTYFHIHSGQHSNYRNQPQVHLGLLATPALNPATETTNFLNSSIYTVSYAHCDVEFDMESMCTKGDPYDWPEDVKFFINKEKGFQGYGAHVFGVAATASGRLESVPRGRERGLERGTSTNILGKSRTKGPTSPRAALAKRLQRTGLGRNKNDNRLREGHTMLSSIESDDGEFDLNSYEQFDDFETE